MNPLEKTCEFEKLILIWLEFLSREILLFFFCNFIFFSFIRRTRDHQLIVSIESVSRINIDVTRASVPELSGAERFQRGGREFGRDYRRIELRH